MPAGLGDHKIVVNAVDAPGQKDSSTTAIVTRNSAIAIAIAPDAQLTGAVKYGELRLSAVAKSVSGNPVVRVSIDGKPVASALVLAHSTSVKTRDSGKLSFQVADPKVRAAVKQYVVTGTITDSSGRTTKLAPMTLDY